MMRIATWNVNSLRVRLPQVARWLESERPDVLAMQETKVADPEFPAAEFAELGYQVIYSGQKTYNGVAIASRAEPTAIVNVLPGFDDLQRRLLQATIGGVTLLNLYVPNGSEVGSDKYQYKLEWLRRLHAHVAALAEDGARLLLLGDFNIAPADIDVHDPAAWAGQVLCSEPEREQFRLLLQLGFTDCLRKLDSAPGRFTWWDYRVGAFPRNLGLRIDHLLASAALAPLCRSCRIDTAPRGWERPSDHAPVIAEFEL
jgi:exodeoxyribonuclease-3